MTDQAQSFRGQQKINQSSLSSLFSPPSLPAYPPRILLQVINTLLRHSPLNTRHELPQLFHPLLVALATLRPVVIDEEATVGYCYYLLKEGGREEGREGWREGGRYE